VNSVTGIQSALHPQGPHADAVAALAWVLMVGAVLILIVVMVLAVHALLATPRRRAWAANERFIWAGGIIFPAVTLTALLLYSFGLSSTFGTTRSTAAVRVEVIGHQWWWRVNYLDAGGALDFVTANEIRIPAGKPIEVVLRSVDVIHSFSVPNLAGKLDMIPGRVNRLRMQADRPGVFRGQCAEYCGGPHAKMAFFVIAHDEPDFELWRARQRSAAVTPSDATAQRGQALFLANCVSCHTIRGTAANGTLGPDLTHVGSRVSLAAGVLPNNVGTLAAWISASQRIKPENLMPSITVFSGEELRAVAAYLHALE
jgi:cytochrome c oxidase subunit II